MFVHRQQGSSPAVGWQPAADRHGRRSLLVRPLRRVRVSETRWSHHPPPGVGQTSGAAGLTSSAGGRQVESQPAPRRHRNDQGVSQPEPLPAADRCRILCLYRLLWAFLCRLGQNLDICAMRANSQS